MHDMEDAGTTPLGATQITSFQQYSCERTPTMRRYMHDHFAIARLRGPDLTLCIAKRRR